MDEVRHARIPAARKMSHLVTAAVATLALLLPACTGRSPELKVGDKAPDFTLSTPGGRVVSLSDYTGSQPVLLYFHMAMGCPPCMQQIVDLYGDPSFRQLNVALVSIAFDSPADLAAGIQEYGIQGVPMLTDPAHDVSEEYGVLQWANALGEPGHTFVLVNTDGTVAWIQDNGAPQNGGQMYVLPSHLVEEIRENLDN